MKNKIISFFLTAIMLCSSGQAIIFADEAVFDVTLNEKSASVDIFYKNTAYPRSEAGVSVVNIEYGEIVYANQIVSGSRGTVVQNGITLPESGRYNIRIWIKNANSYEEKNIIYFSEEDVLRLWEIVAVNGDADEIQSHWSNIKTLFGVDSSYFAYIDDMSKYFEKLSLNRSTDSAQYNEENKKAFSEFADETAFYTAFENCSDTDTMKILADDAAERIAQSDSQTYDLYINCKSSAHYLTFADNLTDGEYEINSREDVVDALKDALSFFKVAHLLERIENAVHLSEITQILTDKENASLLGITEYIDEYESLKNKSVAEKELMKHFDTPEELQKAMKKAIDKAKKAEDDNPPKKPSSTGGGGGGSVTNVTSAGANNASLYANGAQNQVEKLSHPFVDISGVSWAESHISSLYNLGVINGKTPTEFKPDDYITREEFVKLVAILFDLAPGSGESGFYDVDSNAWYAPYVGAAVQAGVIKGMGEGRFGVGLFASRQDIAVMISNAIADKSGAADVSGGFADNEKIADYAKDAVTFLASKGIVAGDENGYFNPDVNATRAQVAVMLSRVYDTFLKEVE